MKREKGERLTEVPTLCPVLDILSYGVLNQYFYSIEAVLRWLLWGIYFDTLIQELRDLGVGAQIGGLFMEVTMYGNDLLLIAPTRGARGV